MPHKKRATKNHIQVKKILANSQLSLIDKKQPKKSFERVPRRENNPNDRKIEQRILNDDSDDDQKQTKRKRNELKKHINKELEQKEKVLIPKKSRKNKYYVMNHPELKDVIAELPKATKRKHEPDEQKPIEEVEPSAKKSCQESKPSICDKLVSHMVTSRFRFLNEKLYTITSVEAKKLFEKDPQSFYAYHQGYSVSYVLTKKTNNVLIFCLSF